jgi:hypothetical protein
MKNSLIILFIIILIASVFVYLQFFPQKGTTYDSIDSIKSNPQSYNGQKVRVRGFVVEFIGPRFGQTYQLMPNTFAENLDTRTAEIEGIALYPKDENTLQAMKSYISYKCGMNCSIATERGIITIDIMGTVRYIGQVTDAPPYSIMVEQITRPLY